MTFISLDTMVKLQVCIHFFTQESFAFSLAAEYEQIHNVKFPHSAQSKPLISRQDGVYSTHVTSVQLISSLIN